MTALVGVCVLGTCHRIHGVGSVALAELGAMSVVTAALRGPLALAFFGPELGPARKALAMGLQGSRPLEHAQLAPWFHGSGPAGLLGAR